MLALLVGGYTLRMWAITAGYHRYFAHRSYRTSRAFQLLLAPLGATAIQNGPIWWASVHRRHHKHSDSHGDPHSPVFRGFWYAHLGWNFDIEQPPRDERSNVVDLMRYPEIRFVDRHDWLFALVYALGCLAIGGWPGVVWGFVVSTVAVFHATLLVNSLAHVWGSRQYPTNDRSRTLSSVPFWHGFPGSMKEVSMRSSVAQRSSAVLTNSGPSLQPPRFKEPALRQDVDGSPPGVATSERAQGVHEPVGVGSAAMRHLPLLRRAIRRRDDLVLDAEPLQRSLMSMSARRINIGSLSVATLPSRQRGLETPRKPSPGQQAQYSGHLPTTPGYRNLRSPCKPDPRRGLRCDVFLEFIVC
jgi:hypothetical protein